MSKVMLKLGVLTPSPAIYSPHFTESEATSEIPLEFTIKAGKLDRLAHTRNPSTWEVEA